MKPPKSLRKKYHTDYSDLSDFAANARLLQSIWRTEQGYDYERYGNFLHLDFAKSSGANFLTDSIFKMVKKEINTQHRKKVIKEPRIWNNLLSSQPLAFNLFGQLKLDMNLATQALSDLYPDLEIEEVTNIEFEHSPGRGELKYTGDASAFDVFIEYITKQKAKSFLGIEVKYAESLKDKPSTHKNRYEVISKDSGIFNMSKLEELKQKPIQQIWRDHLLTLSMFISNSDFVRGDFIYLFPEKNDDCVYAIEKYNQTFLPISETYFKPLTIEMLINTLKKNCSAKWILDFENRYLRFDKTES